MREAGAELAERERQERLREAAALGDAEEVRRLVELGVGLNSQNEVNGWTCLHWACKRNHAAVVAYLLHAGADKDILTKKGERPAQLTSKREIRKMLGVEDDELPDLKPDSDLPIIPNYLANPPFPYVYNTTSSSIPDPTVNGNLSHSEPHDADSPSVPDAEPHRHAPSQHGNAAPEGAPNGGTTPLPRGPAGPPRSHPVLQRTPVYQGPVSWSRGPPSPAGSNQSVPQQENGSCVGPVPAFQPVFFTGAFPLSMQELVLKVRIQNPNLRENDFIEIELDRQELTYKELLRVSCHELGVNPEHVQKIRKLPNTMLRKDKDVARLQDFQELELVLTFLWKLQQPKEFIFVLPESSEPELAVQCPYLPESRGVLSWEPPGRARGNAQASTASRTLTAPADRGTKPSLGPFLRAQESSHPYHSQTHGNCSRAGPCSLLCPGGSALCAGSSFCSGD